MFCIIIFFHLEPRKANDENISFLVIIFASCGGVFVLVLISICLIRYCKRQQKHNGVSDVMAAKVAFPKPEKYDLHVTGSKKDLFRYGTLDISNEADGCQKVGILNDAAEFQ